MARIDQIVAGDPARRVAELEAFRHEVDRLNESTVCEKSELEWPARAGASHVLAAVGLWFTENLALLLGRRRFDPQEPPSAPKPLGKAGDAPGATRV